jgi:hypothetical protein
MKNVIRRLVLLVAIAFDGVVNARDEQTAQQHGIQKTRMGG